MKGKKFDAAEKHFLEKEVKLRQEMAYYRDAFTETNNVNNQLSRENKQLKSSLSELEVKYNKLLEVSKLSDHDIKVMLTGSNYIAGIGGIMKNLNRYL